MDLRRLPSRKSGSSRRCRRPRRRSNSRSRSDRRRKSRPRPRAAVVGVGGPRIRSAWRDDRQDARRNDERLRRRVGRTLRRPNGEEPPAETDPRDPRPRGSPQVAATGRRADRERKAHDPAREAILDAHENGAKSPQRAAEKRRRRALITALKGRHDDDKIEVLDAAYWMKGCSSLGRLRYAVLV